MNLAVLLPAEILAGTALAVLLADLFLPRQGKPYLGLLSAAGLAAALGGTARQLAAGLHASLWGGIFLLDPFALFFQAIVLSAALLVLGVSLPYLERWGRDDGEFYALLLMAVLGAVMMVASRNFLEIYVAMELLSVSSYALAGFLRPDPRSGEAALKYYLQGVLASAALLYGISLLYGLSGSLDLSVVGARSAGSLGVVALVLAAGGFALKIAAVPFHMWAPDTYQGAPAPVAAFLSTASKAAAFAVLARVLLTAFPAAQGPWQELFAVVAAASMALGNLAALGQRNVRRMLAYSSIAQGGYVLIALAVATPAAMAASLFYLAVYVFMNAGAFSVLSFLAGPSGGEELTDLDGLAERRPALALALAVFLISLAGMPLTAGLMGKLYLFYAAVQGGYAWLALWGVVFTVVSYFYYFRVLRHLFWGTPSPRPAAPPASVPAGLALGAATLATVLFGVFPQPLMQLALHALGLLR